MKLVVHKYGGTSMGSPERINNVAKRISKWKNAGYDVVVVVSAMSGETNRLLKLAKEVNQKAPTRELDVIASTGELVSMGLLSIALQGIGTPAVSLNGGQVGMVTDSAYTKAKIEAIHPDRIKEELALGNVVVVSGFQGRDYKGNVTTLGRGGSDTSAVALAAALNADECLIYTDVDGVYTTDPRIVPEARRMDVLSFEEMLELASLGSKVLQLRSVEFAGKYNIPLRVLSSFTDPELPLEIERSSGTLISYEEDPNMEKAVVSGIACTRDEAKVTVSNVSDIPGVAYQILGPIAEANIDVDMIIQNIGEKNQTHFTFTVPRVDLERTVEILENDVRPIVSFDQVRTSSEICKVSVVGIGMKTHAGVAAKMFKVLSDEGINIMMISTSEIKVSIVIADKYMELAVRALHRAFHLDQAQ